MLDSRVNLLIIFGIIGTIFFSFQSLKTQALNPVKPFISSQLVVKNNSQIVYPNLKKSLPVSIYIPSVNIKADIISVGQATDGSIDPPPILSWLAGWYQNSPTPGELGPAIIVGHVDSYQNISVFWRLRYIQPGDLIYVNRTDGKTAIFQVSALQQFNQKSFPTQKVYGNIPNAGLRLITCGGTFSRNTASYDENTVVFATLKI